MRDAAVSSLMTSLKECHSAMDQLQNDKKLMKKEKQKLQERIDDLERRPEPLPCLPELTRAALDQVRKWDADIRVDEQKMAIWKLDRYIKYQDKKIEGLIEDNHVLSTGYTIEMKDFWIQFGHIYAIEEAEEWVLPRYDPSEKLFAFVRRLILEIQDEDDEEEGHFGFSMLLPRVNPAFTAV